MVKSYKKAQAGDIIRVKLEGHQQCIAAKVESLGTNNSGRLVYLVLCSCGQHLRLTSVQIENINR